ncbi:LysM peptidoglycan-binding domain-containing protein [Abiotrophia sp.]|uniref:LysM peptidoglycan-binding domain-containing protein n=2 Tax=Abiotrophia sp. TaxID=76631 RepID=UPI001CAADBD0|nr:LysM peptidoglycan-binding domain-containing protein [Abiotrophia sp.]MBF0936660.1 LysM peptidoglycan-binding domain-containing protein [Abiotrophia sp.]
MKLTRQAVINRRKQAQRHESNKKIAKVVNAGLVLFASASTLSTLTAPKVTVQAQTATQQNFLSTIGGYARDIAKNNDLYASVMIAQAILESGWGQSGLASAPNYNLFGIKGDYNGNSVRMDTLEDDGSGNYYAAKEPFRKYSNYGESLNDYASLLTGDNNPNSWRYKFYYGARVSATNSYQDATQHLTGRYATDTRYASKLNQLIQTYGLTQYDAGGSSTASPARPQAQATGGGSYTVQAGDSYWRIANKYGISIEELQRLNGTSSYFLYPGQSLVVPGSASTTSGSASSTSSSTTSTRSAAPAAGGSYTVQAGDSYWRIANKYGISIQELQRLNGTSDYTLHPGQSIKVPGSGTNASASSNSSSASTSTTSAAPAAGGSYTVQAGDSYWRIANKYGISISELQRLNGTSNYFLYPGQSLKVPGSGSSSNATASSNSSSTSTSTTTAAPAAGGSYTVQAGDSYWRIANKYGISISELQRLNGTSNYFLYPGQSIKVPGSGSASATPAPASNTASTTPAPAETPAPAPSTGGGNYTVQAGDSYWRIANKYGISISELQRLNGTSNYFLYPGQSIKVPGGGAAAETPTPTPAPVSQTPAPAESPAPAAAETPAPAANNASQASGGSYTVQAGDTLYSIARRNGVDVYKLIANNGGSHFIQVGQVISLN